MAYNKKQKKAVLNSCLLKLEKIRADIYEAKQRKIVKLAELEKDIYALYGQVEFLQKLINDE